MREDAGDEQAGSARADLSEDGDLVAVPAPPVQRPYVEPVPLGYAPDVEADLHERQPGIMDRLPGRAARRERLSDLNFAIAAYPEAPVNYVLRGELHLAAGDRAQAARDFEQALALADSAFARSDWGLVAQAARDRALIGLRRAGR